MVWVPGIVRMKSLVSSQTPYLVRVPHYAGHSIVYLYHTQHHLPTSYVLFPKNGNASPNFCASSGINFKQTRAQTSRGAKHACQTASRTAVIALRVTPKSCVGWLIYSNAIRPGRASQSQLSNQRYLQAYLQLERNTTYQLRRVGIGTP